MNHKAVSILVMIFCLLSVCGCGDDSDAKSPGEASARPEITVTRDVAADDAKPLNGSNAGNLRSDTKGDTEGDTKDEAEDKTNEPQTLVFRDVFGEEYETVIDPDVPPNVYKKDAFIHDGSRLIYDDKSYEYMLGTDVSHHQGDVDWEKIKSQGYDFTFLRIGYRGYGKEGSLNTDRMFETNYEKAKKAGILVGVYFFAQAVNEEEAAEEAEYVLGILDGRSLDLPVVYDPESILDDEARTDDVSGEQFTKNTRVFCDAIKAAGYSPMIYSNMLWEAFEYDLSKLSDIPVWYADYEDVPQTPYDFEFWQYSNEGRIDGISTEADLNIWIRPANGSE